MAGPLARLYATFGIDARDWETGTDRIKSTITKMGGTAAAAGTAIGAGIGTAGVAALGIADEYDAALDSIRIGTGATGEALAGLEAQFQSVGGRVTDDIGVVGQVLADLNTRTGQTGDALGSLGEQILDLSRLTGGDAVANVASLTRLYGDWSIATEDQAEANDKLFRASQATGIGIDTLNQQLVQFGAPLRNIGFSFEEATAMLAKWEKEGVNTTLALGGLKIALGEFAKEGIDATDGLAELVDQITNAATKSEAMALGVAKFGSRAGPDMVAAIREGRFAIDEYVDVIENGSDTIAALSDETRDFGDGIGELRNKVKLFIGPIVKDFAGIGQELGNAIYLLPALGGAIGNGLGRMWTKAGGGARVKGAIRAVGAAAGVLYTGAAFVASKFIGAASALWAMLGGPRVLAKAAAAGAAAGAAYAGAAGGGGAIGTILSLVSRMAPLAIPVAIVATASSIVIPPVAADEFSQSVKDIDAWSKRMGGVNVDIQGRMEQVWLAAGKPPDSLPSQMSAEWQALYVQAAKSIMAGTSLVGKTVEQSSGTLLPRLAGGITRAIEGIITTPVEGEFDDAVDAVKAGFGSVKQALANPPALISRDDRISNMETRMRKAMGELRKAVKAEDPVNIAYWTDAVAAQKRRLDKMRGNTAMSTADIRETFRALGIKVDGTWLGIERSMGQHTKRGRRATISELRSLVGDVRGLNLKNAGRALIQSWIDGIKAVLPRVNAIADNITGAFGSFFHGSAVPRKGPLAGFDRMGATMLDAYLSNVRGRRGQFAAAGRELAGAFRPDLSASVAVSGGGADGGNGDVHLHIHGGVYGGPAGLRQLRREMDAAVRPTQRNRRRRAD